jgi:prepilin-type N-terminal cleavage/methylation domain-containing protein
MQNAECRRQKAEGRDQLSLRSLRLCGVFPLTNNAGAVPCNLSPVTSSRRAGFTLVEMLVALSILIILMAAVGEIFSLAGRTVRVGQATLAAMSSIRAVESQIAHDVKHLDTNGFLVIRQRYYAPIWQPGVQYEPGDEVQYNGDFFLCQQPNLTEPTPAGAAPFPPSVPAYGNATPVSTTDWLLLPQPWSAALAYSAGTTVVYGGAYYVCIVPPPGTTTVMPGSSGSNTVWKLTTGYPIWRADQIGFLETGNFQDRTGGVQFGNATMASDLTANKAIVWFGQLTASYGPAGLNYKTGAYLSPTDNTRPATWNAAFPDQDQFEQPYWPQESWVPMGTPPSGETSGQFYFGRQAMLLIPAGTPAGSAANPYYGVIPPVGGAFGTTVYNNPFFPLSYNFPNSTDGAAAQNGGSSGYPVTIKSETGVASHQDEYSALYGNSYATVTSSRLDAAYDAVPEAGKGFTLSAPAPSGEAMVSPTGTGTVEAYVDGLADTPIASAANAAKNLSAIADFFCYRRATLITPGASEIGRTTLPAQQMLNAYYRMSPIMLQGVPSFAVDWTDGASNDGTQANNTLYPVPLPALYPTLNWYGIDGNTTSQSVPGNPGGPLSPVSGGSAQLAVLGNSQSASGSPTNVDSVTYVFYAGNKAEWPKALRITYCVTDPNNRLQGGRWITQVVNLPQ